MVTETFHDRTKILIAKIQLNNNFYYCCFKAMMLSVFYKRAGLGRKKGKKISPKPRNKTKCKYIPEIFVKHRCQGHVLYSIRQYLLAETLVLILNASQGKLNDIIHLTKLRWHHKTFSIPPVNPPKALNYFGKSTPSLYNSEVNLFCILFLYSL